VVLRRITSANENRYSFLPPRPGSMRTERTSDRRREAGTARISATCWVVYPLSLRPFCGKAPSPCRMRLWQVSFLRKTGLEGGHQVDDLGLGLLLSHSDDIFAIDFLLDDFEHPVTHVVFVVRRLEAFRGRLGDQLDGESELRVAHFAFVHWNVGERA